MIDGNDHIGLVISIAKRFMSSGIALEDLVGEGMVGLMKAIKKYDPEKSAFSTYATFWIEREIRRAVNKKRENDLLFMEVELKDVPEKREGLTEDLKMVLRRVVEEKLMGREARVVQMKFGLPPYEKPMTLQEIGKQLERKGEDRKLNGKIGLSKQRVKQIYEEAMAKLKSVILKI